MPLPSIDFITQKRSAYLMIFLLGKWFLYLKKMNQKPNMRDIIWPLKELTNVADELHQIHCLLYVEATEYLISFNNYLITGHFNYSSFWSHEENVYAIRIQIIRSETTNETKKTDRMIYV